MMKTIIVRACRPYLACVILLLGESCLAQFHGKLFTTPEERTYLDTLRASFLRERAEQGFDISESGPPPLPEIEEDDDENTAAPVIYTLGGILARSDGSRTLWINNQPIAEAELPRNMKVVADGKQIALRIGTGGNFLLLKPGQTVNMSTAEILESYQRAPAVNADDTPRPAMDVEPSLQAEEEQEGGSPEPVIPEASSAEAGDRETP